MIGLDYRRNKGHISVRQMGVYLGDNCAFIRIMASCPMDRRVGESETYKNGGYQVLISAIIIAIEKILTS